MIECAFFPAVYGTSPEGLTVNFCMEKSGNPPLIIGSSGYEGKEKLIFLCPLLMSSSDWSNSRRVTLKEFMYPDGNPVVNIFVCCKTCV